ncbi:hypothetical protein HZF24_05790 [Sedimentibacter hydroxybenzoicus DSM 7310]|uniref:Uncharacterized protein n=1 Tax=Sedimentibacter hydroxybenzoicus DSM 7310 TaxID=1123245 RepID=A0A974BI61_SEDHY|nr:hypothetical protein [Sedimentibacter hydroxybenzoicus]NYB73649.1 hypothetical protein [Sedimentibacter hydroxybenzoicus DSM 7310]
MKKIFVIGIAVLLVLSGCTAKTDVAADNDGFDFSVLSDWEFMFSSGAGGWATLVKIAPDGTFSGNFHDSEMGMAGDDYPDGTVYVCNFTGKFTSVKKIGDYEYSMVCENLTQEGIEGEEEIIDGIKYITSTPYGFDDAGEFRLYLPGKEISKLPSEYTDWIYGLEESKVLDFYGLYNIGGEQGFSSYNMESDSINGEINDGDSSTAQTAVLYTQYGDSEFKTYETEYYGELTPDILAESLSELTGLDFFVDFTENDNAIYADWSPDSTLVANLDDREQKEEFFFFDADSMRWFMMDSLWMTLKENLGAEDIYYTMDGGQELEFEYLYATNIIPSDFPYPGYMFFKAHMDNKGELTDEDISDPGDSAP